MEHSQYQEKPETLFIDLIEEKKNKLQEKYATMMNNATIELKKLLKEKKRPNALLLDAANKKHKYNPNVSNNEKMTRYFKSYLNEWEEILKNKRRQWKDSQLMVCGGEVDPYVEERKELEKKKQEYESYIDNFEEI